MRRALLPLALAAVITACSGGGDGDAVQAVTRDSAGVSIVEYPAQAWEEAPQWTLTAEPLATIGGDPADTTVDLSNSQVGTLLSDGRVVAASMQPAQIWAFSPDGTAPQRIGRGGEGPGEYRFLSAVIELGPDTIAAYDLVSRRSLLYDLAGQPIGTVQFPMAGAMIPPLLVGRLNGDAWIFQVINPIAEPPEGSSGPYRVDMPVYLGRVGAESLDTLFMLPGPTYVEGSIDVGGGQSIPMGQAVGYGPMSFVGAHGDMIWSTTGESFTITGRDTANVIKRMVRLAVTPRTVDESEKEVFREALRAQWEMARGMGAPPSMVESELAKIENTVFAEHRPAIGQLLVDQVGRIWATTGSPQVDSTLNWGIFSNEGELLGRVQLPSGTLFAANADRVVVRREDDETGLVRLEVWGVQREP